MKIRVEEIENILGFELKKELKYRIKNFNLSYKKLSEKERDDYLLNVINVLFNDIIISGEHRINQWNKGWDENLQKFKQSKDINDLIPKYYGKYDIVRWNGDVIKTLTKNFDYKIHICLVDAILQEYTKGCKNIYEFGCGPAYHLIRLNNYDKSLNLYGGDWAKTSQLLISEINSSLDIKIDSFNFDFFKPDYNIDIKENGAVYTVAALEQIGENFKSFIDYLLNKKPNICINIEPIDELLDSNNLIDNLSIKYFRKRNYLKGFLPYLKKLEKENKIEIIKQQRINSGSYFIEGHSLVVWKIK